MSTIHRRAITLALCTLAGTTRVLRVDLGERSLHTALFRFTQ
jgi:hypothetical protein